MTVAELIAKLNRIDPTAEVKATLSQQMAGFRSIKYGSVVDASCDIDPHDRETTAVIAIEVDRGVETKSWPATR